MIVPADVAAWLRAEAGMDGGKQARGGMVELPSAAADAIMSGQVVAKILAGRIAELGDAGGNPTAEARLIKQVAAQRVLGPGGGAAPSERLYSWNLLSPVLARLRVGLSDDDKTLIVAGDEEIVVNVLLELKSRLPASKSRPGTNVHRSVSHGVLDGRQHRQLTSTSQPAHPSPDPRAGIIAPINVLSHGDQGRGNRAPAADIWGPARSQHEAAPGMYFRAPQAFGDAPIPFGGYGMNPGPGPHFGGGAAPSIFPAIAGGISPPTNVYQNASNRPGNHQIAGGPPALSVRNYSDYEKDGGYKVHEIKNGGYNGGAAMGGPAPTNFGPPARYEDDFHYGAKPLGGPSAWVNGGGAGAGDVDVRSSGIAGVAGAGAGIGTGASGRLCARILSEAVAANLSIPAADALSAITESRQPLLRRFLAEGLLPAGNDHGGSIAETFLKTLEEQLPPVLSHLSAASVGGGHGAAEEEAKLVFSTIHWAMLSRVGSVALRSCRLLTTFAELLQQHAGGSWDGSGGGGGAASSMSRVVWDWLSARVSPPAGGAIGAALSCLQHHGLAGEHASEVSNAIAVCMYEFSGRGRGLRQLLAVEIPARGGVGRSGGLVLLSKVVEAMGAPAQSQTIREALVRFAVLQELNHSAVRDAGGGGSAAAAAAAAAAASGGAGSAKGDMAAQSAAEDVQAGALQLLVSLWQTYPAEMAEIQGGGGGVNGTSHGAAASTNSAKNVLWTLLKNAMANKTPAATMVALDDGDSRRVVQALEGSGNGSKLQLTAHSLVFRLLEGCIAAKSPDSSIAYRLLVSSLLENYAQEEVRNLVQSTLGRILERTPRMPLGILVEPLMKQMRVCGHSAADLAFHNVLAVHPRLEPAQGLMLLDMMARVCVADERADCRQGATKCLVQLLDSLRDLPSAADFVDRLARLALGVASAVPADASAEALARAASGAKGLSMALGASGAQVPVGRKIDIVRVMCRIARLQSPVYNKHLHAHFLEAMTRQHQMPPELASEFELLKTALSGKAEKAQNGQTDGQTDARAQVSRAGKLGKQEVAKDRYSHVRKSADSVLCSETDTPRAEGSPPPGRPSSARVGDSKGSGGAAARRNEGPQRAPSVPGGAGGARREASQMSERGDKSSDAAEKHNEQSDEQRKQAAAEREAKKEKNEARKEKRRQEEEAEKLRLEEEEKRGPKMTAEERRVANLERAKKLEDQKKAAILEKEKKRETDMKALAEQEAKEQAGKEPKVSAADRRAANLERAKKQQEEKKAAILEKRNKAGNLPNLLTSAEVSKHEAKAERKRRQQALAAGRPSSGLAGKTFKNLEDSDDDDRMSMPDKDRMRINRLRDLSPKTRKREQEIAEIKRKRQMRILEKEAEEVRKREREQGIFRQARAEVERRMAALKGGCGGGGGFLGGLDEEGGGGAGGGGAGGGGERMVPFDVSVVSVAPKRAFNLKRDAEHSVNKGAFDIERHVQMWKFTPKRKENVALALEFLELIFSDATSAGDNKIGANRPPVSDDQRKKGARLKRGEDDVMRQQRPVAGEEGKAHSRGVTPAVAPPRANIAPSRAGAGARRTTAELEEMDKMLLARSAITGDEQLKKMAKRQAQLRKKLAVYRAERQEVEERKAEEERRLKAAMDAEKARERNFEAARRKKLKDKLAQYKLRVELERAEMALKVEQEENLSKADRRKKIQEHLRKKKEEAENAAALVSHAPLDLVSHINDGPPYPLSEAQASTGNGTPRIRGNKKSVLDPTPPKGKADITKGANNRSPKTRSPEKKNGAGGQQAGRMGITPDLLRDDIAPTPTDLGASLDSPIAKSPIGKSPKMPLKPAKVSGSPVTPAPADSLDGKKVTKPKILNKSEKAEAAGGEARDAVDGSAGAPVGDGAPGEAPSGEASAESEAGVAAGDIAVDQGVVATAEAADEDRNAGDAAALGEAGGREGAAGKSGNAAEDEGGDAEAQGKEQKILSPGGREETWEATEEEPADA